MTYPQRHYRKKRDISPLPTSIDFQNPILCSTGVNGTSCFACNKAGNKARIEGWVPTLNSAKLLEQMLVKRGITCIPVTDSQEVIVIISSCKNHASNLSALFELIKKRSDHITTYDVKEAYRSR